MIHTYSLIHDDLPSMDNDDLRRGRPTCHRAFGEAMAILAGDALLTLAFEILATSAAGDGRRLRIIRTIARAAGGAAGMVGGQVLDLEAEGKSIGVDELDALHAAKTGALLTASIVSGAIAAGADEQSMAILETYGRRVGLAFQIADDLLDVTASAEQLGKTPGKDAASLKATYPAIFGIEGSAERARWLVDAAIDALAPFGSRAERLREIACFAIERQK
jgi:geranylgeranyl diphosphate synthase type II